MSKGIWFPKKEATELRKRLEKRFQQNCADRQRKTKDLRPPEFRGSISEPIEGLSWHPPQPEYPQEPIPPLLVMAFPAAFPEPEAPTPLQPIDRDLEKLAFPASFKDEE